MSYELIKSVQSIEEVKKLGTEEEIKNLIEDIISPIKIIAETYEEIFEIILKLQEKWIDFKKGPFINKQEEYIFYLTELEGKQRNNKLGIVNELYEDKKLAKSWYKNIAKYVHPDKSKCKDETAFKVLNDIYQVMIED